MRWRRAFHSSGFDLLSELNRFFRDTDPGLVEENPSTWISRFREILEITATHNDAAGKLAMRFGSEWEMLVRTEENRTEEEAHARETIRMGLLLSGTSLTIALTFLILALVRQWRESCWRPWHRTCTPIRSGGFVRKFRKNRGVGAIIWL
jgi:hypothetical protein